MYGYRFWPVFQRDLKKVRDKKLKDKIVEGIETIRLDPLCGSGTIGDLAGMSTYEFNMSGVSYRIGYLVVEQENLVVFILFGPRENFYRRAKRLFAGVKDAFE